ncbi:MAG: hypothetical protein OXU34_03505 [Gammaproteobacteria bacterium]|nr:hypothetical protein [Gammaproteobacteria bacterium]
MAKPRPKNKAVGLNRATCHSDTLLENNDRLKTDVTSRMKDAGTDFRAAQPVSGGKS